LRGRGASSIFAMDDAEHPRRDLWDELGFEDDVIRFALYD
jgi:hypothetical protein